MGLVASIYIGFDVSYCRPTKENSFMLVNVLCHIYQLEVSISNCLTIPFLNPVGYVLKCFFLLSLQYNDDNNNCLSVLHFCAADQNCIKRFAPSPKGKVQTPSLTCTELGIAGERRERSKEGGGRECVCERE